MIRKTVVVGYDRLIAVLHRINFVVEDLLVSQAPVAKEHHKNRRPSEQSDRSVI